MRRLGESQVVETRFKIEWDDDWDDDIYDLGAARDRLARLAAANPSVEFRLVCYTDTATVIDLAKAMHGVVRP